MKKTSSRQNKDVNEMNLVIHNIPTNFSQKKAKSLVELKCK